MYAIDGLLGLPRKKVAGVSHRKAHEGHLFFCNQEDVDEFVSNSKYRPKVGTEAMTLQCTNYMFEIVKDNHFPRNILIFWLEIQ